MVEEPQATTNLLKRGNDLNFLPTASTSPLVQGDAAATTNTATATTQQLQPPERSTDLNQQQLTRKLLSRHQSITRGTASSRAKAVRPNLNDTASTTTNSHTAEAIIKKRLSAAIRTRKQSLTATAVAATVQAPPTIMENKPLLNVALPSYSLAQRRSSWSPPQQQHQQHAITTTLAPELPSSPSPSPPPALKKVLEGKRRASMIPNPTVRDTTPPDNNNSDSPIAIPASDNVDSKRSNSRVLQKRPSVIMNTDDGNRHNKAASAIMDNNDAAPSAGNQQQTPCSDSCSEAEDSPDIVADESIAIRRPVSDSSSSSTSSSLEHTHTHTHSEDDHLPGYMRRPICAACNRNVKVTSSSESTTAATAAATTAAAVTGTTAASVKLAKSNSTLASSRRSSCSTTATTSSGNGLKKRLSASIINEQDLPPNVVSATLSISTASDHSSSSSSNHSGPTSKAQRSHSPTSPIPTRKRTKNKSALASSAVVKKPSSQLIEKWSQLLSQQQLLLATISGASANANDDQELHDIQQNITKLVTSHQEQYETVLLETQAKILQKFTLLMMQQVQQQQQQQQQQKKQYHHQQDALLFLPSSSATTSLPFGVSASAATITPINIYNKHNQMNLDAATTATTTIATITDALPKSSNWQTKLEYGVTRFKWGMSQWIGSIVGTGEIEEQDFDTLGYPENVIISGVCVTTEPGLLPKGLQKYFKPYQQPDQVICHKYILTLSRQSRLTKFQLKNQDDWVQDDHVQKCEFSIQDRHDYIKRTRHCGAKFGVFKRRHHCRSCGHVFCHEHSSNKLPLFVSNGQDCGEWARVCDTCFYSRIEPQLLTRS